MRGSTIRFKSYLCLFVMLSLMAVGLTWYAGRPVALAEVGIKPIDVGENPQGLAIDPGLNRLYVAVAGTGRVAVINTVSNTVVDQIIVYEADGPNAPYEIAADPVAHRVYVNGCNVTTHFLCIINGNNNQVINSIDAFTSGNPTVNPSLKRLYVSTFTGTSPGIENRVTVVNTETRQVVKDIVVGDSDEWDIPMAVNSVTDRLYAGYVGGKSLEVINGMTNKVEKSLPLPDAPTDVAVDEATNRVFVTYGTTLRVYNGQTNDIIRTLPISTDADAVAVNPNVNRVYVVGLDWDEHRARLHVIDGEDYSEITSILLEEIPEDVVVHPETGTIYVSVRGFENFVYAIPDPEGPPPSTATPTRTPTRTATPTRTLSPTPTMTRTPGSTATPSRTPTTTATSDGAATPTQTLVPQPTPGIAFAPFIVKPLPQPTPTPSPTSSPSPTPGGLPAGLRYVELGTAFNNSQECKIVDPLPSPIRYAAGTKEIAYRVGFNPSTVSTITVTISGDLGGPTLATSCNLYAIILGQPRLVQVGSRISRQDGAALNPGSYTLRIRINGSAQPALVIPFVID